MDHEQAQVQSELFLFLSQVMSGCLHALLQQSPSDKPACNRAHCAMELRLKGIMCWSPALLCLIIKG